MERVVTLSAIADQVLIIAYPIGLVAFSIFIATRSSLRRWALAIAAGSLLLVGGCLLVGVTLGLYVGLVFAATIGALISLLHGWLRAGPRWRTATVLLVVAIAAFFVQRVVDFDPDSRVEEAVERALRSSGPGGCTEYYTLSFLEQSYGVAGERAIAACEMDESQGDGPTVVEVSGVEVSGDRAEAQVRSEGGAFGPVLSRIELVEDERWLLDRTLDAEVDRPRLEASYERWLRSPPDSLSERQARCVLSALGPVSTDRIERALVEGRLGLRLFGGPLVGCTGEQLLRQLGRTADDPAGRSCITAGLRRLGDAELAELLYGDPLPLQLRLIRCDRDAFMNRYRKALEADDRYSQTDIACFFAELAVLPDRGLAESLLSSSARIELGVPCEPVSS